MNIARAAISRRPRPAQREDRMPARSAAAMIGTMNTTTIYQRGVETITVMAYLGMEAGDGDEIRVIHAVDGDVTDDGIAYHGRAGEQWLRDQRDGWSADGFEMISTGPGT